MKVCLIIGYPIKTSKSPLMHNAGYKKLKIDDEFIYIKAEVKPEDLKTAMDGIRALGIKGVSVTMPHKQTVMKHLDKIDKDAQKIGAVNTISNLKGKLTGFNTDWTGAIAALEQKTKLNNKRVGIIGAGGAARAIVYGLKTKGAIIKIYNRSQDKAKLLAEEFDCGYSGLSTQEDLPTMDVIINASSLGMNKNTTPIDTKFLNRKQIIFDIVYSPKETRLIRDAKAIGANVIYGYEMLLYQGAEQFKLYTGLKAPVETMRKALIASL